MAKIYFARGCGKGLLKIFTRALDLLTLRDACVYLLHALFYTVVRHVLLLHSYEHGNPSVSWVSCCMKMNVFSLIKTQLESYLLIVIVGSIKNELRLSYIAVSEPLTKVPDKWAGHKNCRIGVPKGDKELATEPQLITIWLKDKRRIQPLNKGQYISHFFSCLFSVAPSFLGLLWEFCRAH